jgi:hypothetical protein
MLIYFQIVCQVPGCIPKSHISYSKSPFSPYTNYECWLQPWHALPAADMQKKTCGIAGQQRAAATTVEQSCFFQYQLVETSLYWTSCEPLHMEIGALCPNASKDEEKTEEHSTRTAHAQHKHTSCCLRAQDAW